jgi:plastocyanin
MDEHPNAPRPEGVPPPSGRRHFTAAVAAAASIVALSLVFVTSSGGGAAAVGQRATEWAENPDASPANPRSQLIAHSLPRSTTLSSVQTASAGERQAAATTIRVTGGEFFFRLSARSIRRPGRVTFVFRNIGAGLHDFKINGKKTPLIERGKSARLVVAFKKRGRYPYICTVPGHAGAGMKGVFTVR